MPRVVIIGGGISGLSAAYYLSKQGIESTIVEGRPQLGGVIRTENVDGCVLEAGPDSFLAAKPWALDLIRELGLGADVIASNDHQRVTYIVRSGRLVPLPDGLIMMAPTKVAPMVTTRLVSWPAKLRMSLELLRRPPSTPLPERSVADFVREHYGAEGVEYLAEPLLAGVYGGDPEQLSATSVLTRFVELETKYGSISRGLLAARKAAAQAGRNGAGGGALFKTLKGGLGQLTSALADHAKPQVVHGEAETLARAAEGWRVRVKGAWLEAGHVVLAAPAWSVAGLTREIAPELAALLDTVPYNSSTTVALGYEAARIGRKLTGFGFLVPQKERRRLIALTVVGNKFPNRVPDGKVVLRCFLRTAESEAAESIVAAIRQEIARILGVTAEPDFWRVSRWPRSMAQYTVGHGDRVKRIEQEMVSLPGLYLAGNAYYGIGVPDCVRMGKQAAEKITAVPSPSART